jgi:hypothetical protein
MEDLMSAASPAHNQVRRNAAAAPSRAPQPQAHAHAQAQAQAHAYAQTHAPVRQPAPVARAHDFSTPRGEEAIRLNLSDIPPMSTGDLDVEGFKPSLLSRLFDLVAPLDRR